MRAVRSSSMLVWAVVFGACVGAAPRPEDANSVQQAIDARLAEHSETLVRKDVESALTLYTEDVIVRPANSPPLHGRTDARAFMTEWFAAMDMRHVEYTTQELEVYGSRAYQIGTYRSEIELPGQPAFTDHGSFMAIWLRGEDGTWRMHRNIFASSQPAEQSYRAR